MTSDDQTLTLPVRQLREAEEIRIEDANPFISEVKATLSFGQRRKDRSVEANVFFAQVGKRIDWIRDGAILGLEKRIARSLDVETEKPFVATNLKSRSYTKFALPVRR